CLCGNLRRAARLVSTLYESEPGWPKDVSVAQFSLLQAIAREGTSTNARLGWLLGIDQTTLSRSLALLEERGLIGIATGVDRRERIITLSDEGRTQLRRVERAWRRAQARLRGRFGADHWRRLEQGLAALVSAARAPAAELGRSPAMS
ncbi:MAG TPA: MarR family transcriptional regulator, partial [Anaeromyxobacter sp.]|nr:MarR family transcriptional regulator [Anaeromyxobacter sp.]